MNRYKLRREQLGLTAEEAAVKLGVTLSTLYSWERGSTTPRADALAKMAKAYDVSSDWLLNLEE